MRSFREETSRTRIAPPVCVRQRRMTWRFPPGCVRQDKTGGLTTYDRTNKTFQTPSEG
jgi:hypothetical protein